MDILLIRMKSTELLVLVLVLVLVMRASSSSAGAETEQGSIVRTLSQHLDFVTLPSLAKVTLPLRVADCKMVTWSVMLSGKYLRR